MSNKKKGVYIKKIVDVGTYKVWLVDGEYIRKNICEDFVNKGQHYHFKFIPKHEFWISKGTAKKEQEYYVEHLIVEYRLMKKGISFEEAFKKAAVAEKKERKRSKKVKKLAKIKNHEELVKRVHKKLIKKYSEKIRVWLTNGELVRDIFDTDFAGGSHNKVDNYVPKNEIWLDDDMSEHERKFILLHELNERFLMSKGLKYRLAHIKATKIEDHYRHHKSKIDSAIKKELKRQV